jgi:hypothetical protein
MARDSRQHETADLLAARNVGTGDAIIHRRVLHTDVDATSTLRRTAGPPTWV